MLAACRFRHTPVKQALELRHCGAALLEHWARQDRRRAPHNRRQVRGKGIQPELKGTWPHSIPKRTVDEYLIGANCGYDGTKEVDGARLASSLSPPGVVAGS